MGSGPLVSFVIVTRDRQAELLACLAAVSRQAYRPFEALVVDNGSTDDSVMRVRQEFPLARVIRLDRNLGCPGGRNIGALNANGEVLFFLDDDCTIPPDAAQVAVGLFEVDPLVAVVAPRIIERGDSKDPPGCWDTKQIRRYVPTFIGMAAIRRSAFEALGMYPKRFMYGAEENDLALRILSNRGRILYAPELLVYHVPSSHRDVKNDIKHSLENSVAVFWKYAPVGRAIAGTVGKTIKYFVVALRSGALRGWIAAVIRMPLVIMRVLAGGRRSLGWNPFLLHEFLGRHVITSWEEVVPELFERSWILARLKE